jgi:hypothetical protein
MVRAEMESVSINIRLDMKPALLVALLAFLAPCCAWSQATAVETAYVAIVPAGQTDVDSVLGLQRGIELVLCQAGIRPRSEGAQAPSDLKLAASLTKADFTVDAQGLVRECELTEVAATLPDGTRVPLPDLVIRGRSATPVGVRRISAGEPFFMACGANFARAALDALKDKVTLRASSCEEPQPKAETKPKAKPRRDATSRSGRNPASASPKKP